MRGKILHFSIQKNQGQISGDDGKRYQFSGADWNLNDSPKQGISVDFELDGDLAVSIYEDPTSPIYLKAPKSRTIAALIAFFLGGFGIQFFYLDAWLWGILSVVFCFTYIPALIGIFLGIRWHLMSDKEFKHKIKNLNGNLKDLQEFFGTKLDRKSICGVLALVAMVLTSIQMNKQSLGRESKNACSDSRDQTVQGDRRCFDAIDKYNNALGVRL